MTRTKGRPLSFLALVIGGWIFARIIFHVNAAGPLPPSPPLPALNFLSSQSNAASLAPTTKPPLMELAFRQSTTKHEPLTKQALPAAGARPARFADFRDMRPSRSSGGGHELLLMASQFRRKSTFMGVDVSRRNAFPSAYLNQTPSRYQSDHKSKNSPWSAYAWAYARSGTNIAAIATNGQYGSSQAGGILSYRLAGQKRSKFEFFGKVTTAFSARDQEELAVGLRWQPARKIPASIAIEQRIRPASGRSTQAAYVAAGIGPRSLGRGFDLEAFGQTGVVRGQKIMPFFDGALTVEKRVAQSGNTSLSLGAGSWTGGQGDIARLDTGPRASIKFVLPTPLKRKGYGKISVDWRHRVAGKAEPASGMAVTFATQF